MKPFYALKESMVELDKLVNFFENPQIRIEISGHTDNIGSPEYNQKLSDNRSKAVADYLIRAQVAKDRLVCKGYGFSQPIDDNDTEVARAKNRRTEIKIIE
jgi:outer membrane protein OmpA-like peptidoglycan-associated protein